MKSLEIGELLTLDDEIEYIVMNRLNYNNKDYVLFANLDNPEDILIRIEEFEDDELYLSGLEDSNEFDDILKLFKEQF